MRLIHSFSNKCHLLSVVFGDSEMQTAQTRIFWESHSCLSSVVETVCAR